MPRQEKQGSHDPAVGETLIHVAERVSGEYINVVTVAICGEQRPRPPQLTYHVQEGLLFKPTVSNQQGLAGAHAKQARMGEGMEESS